jgi:NADH:ubiquinone oxidoreductase subunit F (NADH-binding)
MPGKQLLMTFPVTATSHTLADYRARGGYATLEKALRQMQPEEVTKEVTTPACSATAAPRSRPAASGASSS